MLCTYSSYNTGRILSVAAYVHIAIRDFQKLHLHMEYTLAEECWIRFYTMWITLHKTHCRCDYSSRV